MARTALIVKTRRRQTRAKRQHKSGQRVIHPTRVYNRCQRCGRNGGYMRKFKVCRICFRELAREGKIMGVKHSSW